MSSLALISRQTLSILESGCYLAPSGVSVDLRETIALAVDGTLLYEPEHFDWLPDAPARFDRTQIEVTDETTAAAGRRLVAEGEGKGEGETDVVALNFASAKNPGGGFQGGAKAQEEDLARASGLYPCLLRAPLYYEANRSCGSMLYTDHIIWSPAVPFFRDDRMDLLETPFRLSMVTAPAPNAGEARKRGESRRAIQEALDLRARRVLQVCADRGHATLVLGAWGCGVFRNDPVDVADAFGRWLAHPSLAGRFQRVVFAVWDPSPTGGTLATFQERFGR